MNAIYAIIVLALVLLANTMSYTDHKQTEAALKNPQPKTYYAYKER